MPDITYRFVSTGADTVARQFGTIAEAAQKQRAAVMSANKVSARAPNASYNSSRAAERSATQAARAQSRAADSAAKDFERAEQRKTKAVEREANKRAHAETRAAEKAQRDQKRLTERSLQARDRQDAQRDQRAGAVMSSIAGAAASILQKGLEGLGAVVADRMQVGDSARRLSISARGAGEKGVDYRTLQTEAEGAARTAPGSKAQDILEAQQRFVAMTGDLGTARMMGGSFATASMASGAKAEDIAATAATFSQKFGITDQGGMQKALASMLFQGKSGAFELSDAASYYQSMGAAGSRFGLDKGAGGVATLGGLAQVARSATGSGAQASTAVQSMFDDLIKHSENIRKMNGGKDAVFTDKTHTTTRDIKSVLADTIGASGGDKVKLGQVFGSRGMRAVSPLITAYNDAAGATSGTAAQKRAAGEAAVTAALNGAINATSEWSEVQKDAAEASKSNAAIQAAIWETVASTIGTVVDPALAALGDNLDSVQAVSALVADALAGFADDLGGVAEVAKRLGFLRPEKQGTAEERLGKNVTRQGELNDLAKKGPLSIRQKSELLRLKQEEIELNQKVQTGVKLGDKDAKGGLAGRPGGLTRGADGMYHSPYEGKPADGLDNGKSVNLSSGNILKDDERTKTGFEKFVDGTSAATKRAALGIVSPAYGAYKAVADVGNSLKSDAAADKLAAAADKLSAAADKQAQGNPLGAINSSWWGG